MTGVSKEGFTLESAEFWLAFLLFAGLVVTAVFLVHLNDSSVHVAGSDGGEDSLTLQLEREGWVKECRAWAVIDKEEGIW
jgi:hypothetical protein